MLIDPGLLIIGAIYLAAIVILALIPKDFP